MDLIVQAIVMGIVQGLTEFLPVSSSGHLILVPALLGWHDPFIDSLVFSVLLHMATLLALLIYFRADWFRLIPAWFASIRDRSLADDPDRKLAWLIAVSTVPAVIAGLALGDLAENPDFRAVGRVAIALVVGAALLWLGERVGSRRDYVGISNALLLFVALTAPDIMCPDRRQRVLPLLFARPLTGVDYVLAKVGAMTAILFGFSFLPQVVLFVGQMLVNKDGALDYAGENAEVIWQVPIAVGLLSLYYAVIGVAISSLTSRRIIAGASIVALFLVTSVVSVLLIDSGTTQVDHSSPPATILDANGEPVVVIGPGGENDDPFGIIEPRDPTAAQLLNLAALPLVLRDLVFLGEVPQAEPMSGIDHGGLYAIVVYTLVVGGAFATLFIRYDEVER